MKINNRIAMIEQYHFKRMDNIKNRLLSEGKEIFDFGIGDPDLELHPSIKNALVESLSYKHINKYPPYEGILPLKEKIIKYYKKVYNVDLDTNEIIILIGSKEGISNIFPAVCDINDYAIIPQPGYPVYETCSKLWGVIPYKMPLIESQGYYPRLDIIPESISKIAKLMIINYPNNPTGAVLNSDFLSKVKAFSEKYNIVLCNDNAYNEILNPEIEPLSILMGGKNNCIEFGTFSKSFNMTGFRIGYAVGDKSIIEALLKIKSNTDSGQFMPIQYSAIAALSLGEDYLEKIKKIYNQRRIVLENILMEKNISFFKGKGTFYCWCNVPQKYTTDEFCEELLYKSSIVVTPGYVFGKIGYNHFRISLTQNEDTIERAFSKIDIYY
ncbi:aminotransferase class I/II-fold pyridoxal phosphate-dependent enzyme [Desnuesiella massiliensis]|uniref:aminotransferase class I/II-fold pyridoxal phosphate-dependent enzyme n=1 Tax=Desnuesiella massiliensis TaxID=1650662 RepID=UPI0012B5D450|nr:aminotransferase class I/II-fold pyridoxal phosphate-dependent enzyme [Desnuesiella massiliensis]